MYIIKRIFFTLIIIFTATACKELKIPGKIFESSERSKYERSFSGADSLMAQWKSSFSSAVANRLMVGESNAFTFFANQPQQHAVGYSLELKKGDQLVIEASGMTPPAKIFVDVFEPGTDTGKAKSEILENGKFTRFTETSGLHKVVIQPEIGYRNSFEMKIYTQPSIAFPVAGKGNRDVQSFWGASRDGGGRSHEGVDIFAPRGTPIVAVTDGFITRTGNQGLGGKQVWLRDGILGNSYYYAHLDSILTEGGRQVKTGDTLGRIGNTGNAAGGPTHLHFGIYTTGGAVDPYPYLRKRSIQASGTAAKLPEGKWIKSGTNLRSGPGTKYEILSTINTKMPVEILTAFGSWYHIKTADGKQGFVQGERLQK
ncbi:murein DD-endopeptidase MepM/ murein hydrolase activator NlpD [Chryseobacterium sp. SORGH_AS 447]|uniref:M23 family metallopeptidase n=1 Tax=Chryseobacterium sp. SORGH_AS_0447 TaxID=3041769 RepID=UPI0027820EAD|nr:M23 family metallopeptidase [Chryseobacterium sp. SORGH_AS_0447]MDQ1161849.1 murein DD-endopeptidase MepM/ murein hydrolase activator NlpD [Chryseobacterium sp. SORGH_AS_0447]